MEASCELQFFGQDFSEGSQIVFARSWELPEDVHMEFGSYTPKELRDDVEELWNTCKGGPWLQASRWPTATGTAALTTVPMRSPLDLRSLGWFRLPKSYKRTPALPVVDNNDNKVLPQCPKPGHLVSDLAANAPHSTQCRIDMACDVCTDAHCLVSSHNNGWCPGEGLSPQMVLTGFSPSTAVNAVSASSQGHDLNRVSALALHHLTPLDGGFDGLHFKSRKAFHFRAFIHGWGSGLDQESLGGRCFVPNQDPEEIPNVLRRSQDGARTIRFPARDGVLTQTAMGWELDGKPVLPPGQIEGVENVCMTVLPLSP